MCRGVWNWCRCLVVTICAGRMVTFGVERDVVMFVEVGSIGFD